MNAGLEQKLNSENFFCYYIWHPRAEELTEQERCQALVASIALAILCVFAVHLISWAFLYDHKFKIQPSPTDPAAVTTTADKVLQSAPPVASSPNKTDTSTHNTVDRTEPPSVDLQPRTRDLERNAIAVSTPSSEPEVVRTSIVEPLPTPINGSEKLSAASDPSKEPAVETPKEQPSIQPNAPLKLTDEQILKMDADKFNDEVVEAIFPSNPTEPNTSVAQLLHKLSTEQLAALFKLIYRRPSHVAVKQIDFRPFANDEKLMYRLRDAVFPSGDEVKDIGLKMGIEQLSLFIPHFSGYYHLRCLCDEQVLKLDFSKFAHNPDLMKLIADHCFDTTGTRYIKLIQESNDAAVRIPKLSLEQLSILLPYFRGSQWKRIFSKQLKKIDYAKLASNQTLMKAIVENCFSINVQRREVSKGAQVIAKLSKEQLHALIPYFNATQLALLTPAQYVQLDFSAFVLNKELMKASVCALYDICKGSEPKILETFNMLPSPQQILIWKFIRKHFQPAPPQKLLTLFESANHWFAETSS